MIARSTNRPFVWFTIGQTVSFFGDKLHSMALIGLIGTASPASAPLLLSAFALLYCVPFVLIVPVAGLVVDRISRKRALVACDALRAVLVALIPLSAAAGGLVALFAIVGAVFVLSLIFDVAKMAIVPDLVPPDDLLHANAVLNITARLATLAGIVLGGLIVGWTLWPRLGLPGYAAAFYLDSATFAISVVTLLAVPGRSAPASPARPTFREGLTLARRDRLVWFTLASSGLLGILAGCLYVVIVLAVQTRTAWGTAGVGFVVGIMACGIVVGGVAVGRFGRAWRKETVIGAAFAAMAALLVAAARPFRFPLHGPLSFAAGVLLGPAMIAQDTLLHERLPEDARGRVFSLRDVVVNVAFGLSAAAAGVSISVLSSIGVGDPYRPVLLVLAPVVLLATGAGTIVVRGEGMLLAPATWLLRFLPLRAADAIAVGAADFCAFALRGRGRTLKANLELIAPGRPRGTYRRLARETFRNLARCSVDLLRIPLLSKAALIDLVDMHGLEHLDRALARGKGVVFVTAHVGNWELAGTVFAARGYPIHAIAEDGPAAGEAYRAYEPYRSATGMGVIPLSRSGAAAYRVLRGGEILALAADRALGGTGYAVRFCGGHRLLPAGPARLARRCDASILIFFVVRDPSSSALYRGVVEPIEVDRTSGDERDVTQAIADRLSRVIEAYPDQWFVFQPEWLDEKRRSQISYAARSTTLS